MNLIGRVCLALLYIVTPGVSAGQELSANGESELVLQAETLRRIQLNFDADCNLNFERSHPNVGVIVLFNDMFTKTGTSRAESFDYLIDVLGQAVSPTERLGSDATLPIPKYSQDDCEKIELVLAALRREDEAFYYRAMEPRTQWEGLVRRAAALEIPFQMAIVANHNQTGENEFFARLNQDRSGGKFHWWQATWEADEIVASWQRIDLEFPADKADPAALQPLSDEAILRRVLEAAVKRLAPEGKTRFVIYIQSYGDAERFLLPALNAKVKGGSLTPAEIVSAALSVELGKRADAVGDSQRGLPVISQISRFLEAKDGSQAVGIPKERLVQVLEELEIPVPLVIWNGSGAALNPVTEKKLSESCRHLGYLYTERAGHFPFQKWDFESVLDQSAIASQRETAGGIDRLFQRWLDQRCRNLPK